MGAASERWWYCALSCVQGDSGQMRAAQSNRLVGCLKQAGLGCHTLLWASVAVMRWFTVGSPHSGIRSPTRSRHSCAQHFRGSRKRPVLRASCCPSYCQTPAFCSRLDSAMCRMHFVSRKRNRGLQFHVAPRSSRVEQSIALTSKTAVPACFLHVCLYACS